jgi:uncharacterized damage-inducible protein DinB
MNREILLLSEKLKDVYEGDPWFGRNAKELLGEVDEHIAFEKPSAQHSILEILWHMVTWKEFAISRLRNDKQNIRSFEQNDWRQLDHTDRELWRSGLKKLFQTHNEMIEVLQQQTDEILSQRVEERRYDFRKLLYGVLEHDIYHLGQIAYIKKLLQK